jgi:hypothetical protein
MSPVDPYAHRRMPRPRAKRRTCGSGRTYTTGGASPSAWQPTSRIPTAASATHVGSPGLASEQDVRLTPSEAFDRRLPPADERLSSSQQSDELRARARSCTQRASPCLAVNLAKPRPASATHVGSPGLASQQDVRLTPSEAIDRRLPPAPMNASSSQQSDELRARARSCIAGASSFSRSQPREAPAASATHSGSPGLASEQDVRLTPSEAFR